MKWRALFTAFLLSASAQATDAPLHVRHAWVRWLPGDLPAAAYATITNSSDKPARLLGADSPDYRGVMLHRSFKRAGIEHMQMIDGIDIPAHGSIKLAPGAYHLMLMHARHAVAPGDHVHLNLHFAGDRLLGIDIPVRPANASDH
ncbi:MAG: copper chaperone PCu(A)C [Rudaea sp.]